METASEAPLWVQAYLSTQAHTTPPRASSLDMGLTAFQAADPPDCGVSESGISPAQEPGPSQTPRLPVTQGPDRQAPAQTSFCPQGPVPPFPPGLLLKADRPVGWVGWHGDWVVWVPADAEDQGSLFVFGAKCQSLVGCQSAAGPWPNSASQLGKQPHAHLSQVHVCVGLSQAKDSKLWCTQ